MSYNQKLYHFGSYNDSSIEMVKLEDSSFPEKMSSTLNRSKFQCVTLSAYCSSKGLIMGGKSMHDEKLSTILEFDFLCDKIRESNFNLSEPKSGFGALVK